MSALEIRRFKRGSKDLRFCDMPGCKIDPWGGFEGSRRVASAELFIVGLSAGRYCPRHTKELAGVYDEAAGVGVERDLREALAA